MPPKTRFILELAAFLADHPNLVKQDPAFLLEAIHQGHEAPEEMQDLLIFLQGSIPHLVDEHDVQEAILEAVRMRALRNFTDDEPPTVRTSMRPPKV